MQRLAQNQARDLRARGRRRPARFRLPAEVVEVLEGDAAVAARIREGVILELLRAGRLSKGKTAELLGVDLDELLAKMNAASIPWFDYAPGELEESLAVLDQISPRST